MTIRQFLLSLSDDDHIKMLAFLSGYDPAGFALAARHAAEVEVPTIENPYESLV